MMYREARLRTRLRDNKRMIDNERALVACCPGSAAVTDSPRRKRYFTGCLRLVGWAFEGASVIRFRLHTHWRSSFPPEKQNALLYILYRRGLLGCSGSSYDG